MKDSLVLKTIHILSISILCILALSSLFKINIEAAQMWFLDGQGNQLCWYDTWDCSSTQCHVVDQITNSGKCPFHCENRPQCSDGTFAACGNTCPGGGGDPGGGGCTHTSWGACSVSCGGGTQTDNCGNTQDCNTQACCTNIGPTAAGLQTPTSGQVFTYNSPSDQIEFNWSNTDWGVRCAGENRSYRLYIYGGTCAQAQTDSDTTTVRGQAGAWYLEYEGGPSPSKTTRFTLPPDRTYCWGVWKYNYGQVWSGYSQFRIQYPSLTTPNVTPQCYGNSSGFSANWSGGSGQYYLDIDTTSGNPSGTFWNYGQTTSTSFSGAASNFREAYSSPFSQTNNPFNISAGSTYYLTVYDSVTGLRSPARSFVAENCDRPSNPTVNATCSGNQPLLNISWTGNNNNYWVDIDNQNPKSGIWYNYNTSSRSISVRPSDFKEYNSATNTRNTAVSLALTPGQTYYVSVYDAVSTLASPGATSFVAPSCCGNGVVEPGETCDAGGNNGVKCDPGGSPGASCNYCSSSCQTQTAYAPKGVHDGVSCTSILGWTCDQEDYNITVAVHVYERLQSGGATTFIASGNANVAREPAVGAQCGGNVNHGFNIPFPDSSINGEIKNIYTYAINPDGGNPLLTNSPGTIDTLTCISRPTVTSATVTNDTCGANYSGSTNSIDPSVTNPLQFRIRATEPRGEIVSVELYFVPKTANDGARVGVFESADNPFRTTVRGKIAPTESMAIAIDPRSGTIYAFDQNGNSVSRPQGQTINTFRGTVTATRTGTSRNADVTFTVEFNDKFYNGQYSVYYTVINNWNATPANDGTRDQNQIRLTRWGDWGVDVDAPNVLLTDPTFITNSEYTVTRSGAESGALNQSGLDNSKTRAYLYTPNTNSLYQYKTSTAAPFQNVTMINSANPAYPSTASNINTALTGTFTYKDLRNELEIPVGHALYLSDRACNVGFAVKDIAARALEPAWLMSVGGSISAADGVENIEIPNTNVDIPEIYDGEATLSTETVIIGNNELPSDRVSSRSNILTQYTDEAISVPGEANFDDWYSHILDRVQQNTGTELSSVGDVTIDEFFSNSGLFEGTPGGNSNRGSSEDINFTPIKPELLQKQNTNNAKVILPENLDIGSPELTQYYGYEQSIASCARCNPGSTSYCNTNNYYNMSYFCNADYGLTEGYPCQYGSCQDPKPPLQSLAYVPQITCFRFNGSSCENGTFAGNCPSGWSSNYSTGCPVSYYGGYGRGNSYLYRCTTDPYDGNQCEQFQGVPDNNYYPYTIYYNYHQCINSNACEKKALETYCYQCTSTLSDSPGSCYGLRVLGSTCPSEWTDQSACQNYTCPAYRTCYRCSSRTDDGPYSCEPVTISSGTCESYGYSSSYSCHTSQAGGTCPHYYTAYRCTGSTVDGNACESYLVEYDTYVANPGAYNLDGNCARAAGGSCPMTTTCYRCTSSTRDGNTCEPFVVNGASCPGGTSNSPTGCASVSGGICPVDTYCYSCTDPLTDSNACTGRWYAGSSCPAGTSAQSTGCAAAVGGMCPGQLTCYQCTSSVTDGNTCQPFTHFGASCPGGTSNSPTGFAAAAGGAYRAQVTCSRCTGSTTDQGACENRTFDQSTCPVGWLNGTNTCNNCPAVISCSRCTTSQSDAANACENRNFDVSSSNYTCPPGWVNGTNTCGQSCPVEKTCYRCTQSLRDGNACEQFIYQGSICPSGSSENPNCSAYEGGSCPIEIDCYICTDSTADGNACTKFPHRGNSCPSGTSSSPNGCGASAPGGVCLSIITCYKCTEDKYDEDACEPFVHQGLTCPAGSSSNSNGCGSSTVEGFCPRPEHRDTLEPVMVDNLTIRSGAVCDQQAVIFVQGNLIIEPDITTRHNQNGCIFVVNGDVIIKDGERKTNTNIFTNEPSQYDIIEGFFIVNGTFRTELDSEAGDTFKWDGLMIKGGVYARNLDLKRNLNGNGNGNLERPAHLFVHDGRYKKIYENSFGSRFYSIRENTD